MPEPFREHPELEKIREEISSLGRKDREAAVKRAEEAVERALEMGRQDYAAVFLAMKAAMLSAEGRKKEAIAVAENAMRMAREAEASEAIVTAATVLIDLYHTSGFQREAERVRALAERHLGEARITTRFRFWNALAILLFDMGKLGEAEKQWRRCLAIAEKMNDPRILAVVYNNLGEVYRIRGQFEEAIELYNTAYRYSEESEEYAGMAVNMLNIADVLRKMGKLDEAERYLRESWKLYEKHRVPRVGAAPLRDLAKLLADRGRLDEARECAARGLELALKSGNRKKIGELLMAEGYVKEVSGDLSGAVKSYLEALKHFQEIEDVVAEAECEVCIARAFMKSGKRAAANTHLQRARRMAEEVGHFYLLQEIARIERDLTES